LLLGEGMEAEGLASVRGIVEADNAVERAGDILTMYMGPHALLVNLEVVFKVSLQAEAIHEAIHR
ncbi:MAG TPA: cation transporter, partial [Syntrophobacteraceae bacterium]|nr:cation transporter [Syntrophobacteraceae bacterium]